MSTYPFQRAVAHYDFVQAAGQPLNVKDLSGNGRDGTLSDRAIWTNYGLQLDGSQTISIPNSSVSPAGKDFTVFMIVQPEVSLDDTSISLVEWGNSLVKLSMNQTDGLSAEIHDDGCSGNYMPRPYIPFGVALRLDALGQYMDLRVANTYGEVLSVATDEQQSIYTFKAEDGSIGINFVGTLICFAIFPAYCSNGRINQMFRKMPLILADRGFVLADTIMTDYNAFQIGAFQ